MNFHTNPSGQVCILKALAISTEGSGLSVIGFTKFRNKGASCKIFASKSSLALYIRNGS
jgi:hypothetical protein